MTKEQRLRSGESLMSHAMVFTGYDKRDGEEAPNKWRVENRYFLYELRQQHLYFAKGDSSTASIDV